MTLLETPSGHMINPSLVQAVVMFAGKGVVFRNEFNKTQFYEPEPDPFYQKAMVRAFSEVLKAGRAWQQPNWKDVYAEADKKREAAKVPSAMPDVKGRPAT